MKFRDAILVIAVGLGIAYLINSSKYAGKLFALRETAKGQLNLGGGK